MYPMGPFDYGPRFGKEHESFDPTNPPWLKTLLLNGLIKKFAINRVKSFFKFNFEKRDI